MVPALLNWLLLFKWCAQRTLRFCFHDVFHKFLLVPMRCVGMPIGALRHKRRSASLTVPTQRVGTRVKLEFEVCAYLGTRKATRPQGAKFSVES